MPPIFRIRASGHQPHRRTAGAGEVAVVVHRGDTSGGADPVALAGDCTSPQSSSPSSPSSLAASCPAAARNTHSMSRRRLGPIGGASRGAIDPEVRDQGLGGLNALITRWILGTMLRRRAYTSAQLETLVGASPFRDCEIHQEGIGFELRLRKSRPKRAAG